MDGGGDTLGDTPPDRGEAAEEWSGARDAEAVEKRVGVVGDLCPERGDEPAAAARGDEDE